MPKSLVMLVAVSAVVGCGRGTSEVEAYTCNGSFIDMSGRSTFVEHNVYVYPDGGVLTVCSVTHQSVQFSTTTLYRPKDPGSKTGACFLQVDVGNAATGGFFAFETNESRTHSIAVYRDADTPSSPTSMKCTHQPAH